MVKLKLNPTLARLLIAPREEVRKKRTLEYLDKEIKEGNWGGVPPIWVTPNFILNGLLNGLFTNGIWHPTIKPFIVYNGTHRRAKSIESGVCLEMYVRYTPWNPDMPPDECCEYRCTP